tara:strand:- start:129 stop:374 length:246 start_codon:yes stop_codon:yes gene_type:complete
MEGGTGALAIKKRLAKVLRRVSLTLIVIVISLLDFIEKSPVLKCIDNVSCLLKKSRTFFVRFISFEFIILESMVGAGTNQR